MALSRISQARIAGIAAAVPDDVWDVERTAAAAGVELAEAQRVAAGAGVFRRPVAPPQMCTSDMCAAAAERLLAELGWERDSVDALLLVTQTPDYHIPSTACVLHARLGLSQRAIAYDVNLGCSGYIYGLWLASQHIAAAGLKRVLLLAGETATWVISPQDRATAFLFGDAGTATALEFDAQAEAIHFVLGSDGSGAPHICMPGGGFRHPASEESVRRVPDTEGVPRTLHESRMNGPEVFAFTLRVVPPLLHDALEAAQWSMDDLDAFVPHQANLFMLEHLRKRVKLPREKMVLALEDYGNTSSASIPLSIVARMNDRLRNAAMNVLLSGFGVGWSWGAAALRLGPLKLPPVVSIPAGARL